LIVAADLHAAEELSVTAGIGARETVVPVEGTADVTANVETCPVVDGRGDSRSLGVSAG
jgi:hypothetical protein